MNVAIEELNSCQKKLTIQLSTEEVNKEYQAVIRDLRKNVTIPGFRKGKASISTIRRRFSGEIKNEVKEKLLEQSLKDALVQHKISPVGTPSLDVKNLKIDENQPVEYHVEVEVIPTFEVTDYKGVEIAKPSEPDVPESDITQMLEMLQRQHATNEPVEDDYCISDGTSATINYEQKTLDGELIGEPVTNFSVWVGVDSTLPELYQFLLGKKKGDRGSFRVTSGEDAQNKELVGETTEFSVEVVNVEKVVLPEIDDEFAKDLEQETLEDLKQQIKENIKARREQDAIIETKNQILLKLAETHLFDIPPSLLKDQKKKYPNKEEEELKKMLRAGIIMGKIQVQENIEVTEEEVNTRIQQLATQSQMPVATMRNYLEQQGGLERVRSDILETKTLDFLYEHAHLVEEQ
jgi:trigger factor